MAITCPKCGASFDATLFQFGRTVRCDCGETVALERGHVVRLEDRPEGPAEGFGGGEGDDAGRPDRRGPSP